jgi:hypothetical protein
VDMTVAVEVVCEIPVDVEVIEVDV